MKDIIRDLGFHHSWGYYIDNDNKHNRIKLETSKNRIYLYITKNGNNFISNNKIIIDKKIINLDYIKNQLAEYFNLK